jgi:hypothetical protein
MLFRSSQTGQIAFALAGSFFLAALIAHQVFPVPMTWPFWAPPLLLAVVALGSGTGVSEVAGQAGGPEWFRSLMVARGLPVRAALPIHWLSMGVGGAIGGLWLSRRLHEGKAHAQAQAAEQFENPAPTE